MQTNRELQEVMDFLIEFDGGCKYKSIMETIEMLKIEIEQNNEE